MSTLAGISPDAERRWILDWIEGQSLLTVRPKLLSGIAIHAGQYYDAALARVDGQTIVAQEAEGWSATPPAIEPTTLFCGLSVDEYHTVCHTGQMPITAVLVDDPLRALSTQWANAPTFEHPAIVARVTRPMPARGGGLTSVITEVHVGRPYRISTGSIKMQRIDNRWTEGDRTSPTSWLVWKQIDPGTVIEDEPHAYRLGWCLTCNTPRYDCRGNERSGNWHHESVKGHRGGSAPGGSGGPAELHSAGDALHSLLNGEPVNIAKEDVRDFVEKARQQPEDPDLTDVQVEGMKIFGGDGLGIERKKMPQIPKEHRKPFLKELEDSGVVVEKDKVSPLDLAPTQKEISARNVGEKLKEYEDDPDREFPPVLVDRNNKVLEGHHHWGMMATVAIDNPKVKIPVRRIMLSNAEALAKMKAYAKAHGIKSKDLANTPTKDKAQGKKIAASETFDLIGTSTSGNHGHEGRPGQIGGSAPGDGGGSDKGGVLSEKGTGEILHVPPSQSPDLGKERPTPIVVTNVADAVSHILKGDVVEITDVRHVHTVLEKLAAMAKEAKANKGKELKFDLCKVSVQGSNLFCGSAIKTKEFPNGVPRIKMPQLKTDPVPGSKADALPKDKEGKVDATEIFIDHLRSQGIPVGKVRSVPANLLKATQIEMKGQTVAGMMTAQPDPVTGKTYDPGEEPILVSRDGYVLDGHHRWAAVVGRDSEDGRLGQSRMNVRVIDATMSELFHRAQKWTDEYGLQAKSATTLRAYTSRIFNLLRGDTRFLLDGWDEGQHPRANDGKFDEAGGGGGESSSGNGSNKEATAKAGWKNESRSFPSTQAKSSGATSSGSVPAHGGSTDGKPTGPTTTADMTAGIEHPPATMSKIMDKMPPDERQALDVGYKSAQEQDGFKGSIEDFFAEQAALYQHAGENDPRLKTWFYGDTLSALLGDKDSGKFVSQLAAKQQEANSKQSMETRDAIAKSGTTSATTAGGGMEGITSETPELADANAAPLPNVVLAEEEGGGGGGGGGGKKEAKAGAGQGGEAGAAKASATAIMGGMKGDEAQALNAGYATAQAGGYKGSIEDYFVQQVALYQYAQEGDPRLGTFFYGDTLSKATSDPTLMAQVQTVIAQQKAPAPKPAAKKKPAATTPATKLFWDKVVSLYGTSSSGNYGHEGRPGQVGGSAGGNGNGSSKHESQLYQTGGGGGSHSVIQKAVGAPKPNQPGLPEPKLSAEHVQAARDVLEPEAKSNGKIKVKTDDVLMAMDANAKEQFAAFIEKANETQPAMVALTRAIAEKIGGSAIGPNPGEADAIPEDEPYAQFGHPKSLDRAVRKALGKDTGDAATVRDAVRNSIAVNTVEELPAAIAAVVETAKEHGVEIVVAEDRFAKPESTGYRDLQLLVKMPNGIVGEVQVHVKPMLEAKNGEGHKLFEQIRVIREQYTNRPTGATPEELAEVARLETQSKALYGAAWKKAGGK